MACSVLMKVKPVTKEYLEKLKIHPRQPYDEVIQILIKEHLLKGEEDGME